MFNLIKKTILFIPKKLIALNNSVNQILELPDKADRTFTYVSKLIGSSVGSAGAAKGTADFLEAVACQDGICATISAIGVAADGLQVCTSFIPGPNVTAVITMPISIGCKVFVYCCKKSKLPWGGC
jgi:hypothetical protein